MVNLAVAVIVGFVMVAAAGIWKDRRNAKREARRAAERQDAITAQRLH